MTYLNISSIVYYHANACMEYFVSFGISLAHDCDISSQITP